MNFRHIIFILVYFILSKSISSTTNEEAPDLVNSESQIELPPFNIVSTTDNPTINIAGSAAEHASNDDTANAVNHAASEQTESLIADVVDDNKEQKTVESKNDENEQKADINKAENIQENLTIPVFSEWTQQQMQEAEKKLVELTGNSTESNKDIKNETQKHQVVKMRQKNYASPDCGAKILANNPEAQSSSSVLSDKDEYMLSPCTDRIWFVIELCDSIQAKRVELANFELFSSPLKSVSISVSNRFPTRDWTDAGHYDAKSERDVQVFELKDITLFGKFVRVDLEYTNTEHYCPLSFFRIFGTSEIEAFEVENEPDNRINHIEEDDDFIHAQNNNKPDNSKDTILNRAGAAVMSIVQKAAEVLVKSNGNGAKEHVISSKQFQENCMSLSHMLVCEICSNDERKLLNNIITCKNSALKNLLENEVKEYLLNTVTCNSILGFDLKSDSFATNRNFIASILPEKYIVAMCNLVASDQKALPLRIEDISDITSKLISKKDEVSLKNVSGDSHADCKQPNNNNSNNIEALHAEIIKNVNESSATVNSTDNKEVEKEEMDENKANVTSNPDEKNIFNHIEKNQPYFEESDDTTVPTSTTIISTENTVEIPTTVEPINAVPQTQIPPPKDPPKEVKEPMKEEEKKIEISKLPDSQPMKGTESRQTKPNEPSQPIQEIKTEPIVEIKATNNQAPESVFLRLSNRIKVLEKNMTLSTQYLEELSRRYKKQIEDLQQAYSKLQLLYDNLNQSKKETEKRDVEDKRKLRDDLDEINKKSDFLEIILIFITALLLVLIILIVVLFKRLSILRDAFVMDENRTLLNTEHVDKVNAEQSNGIEKARTNGTKKKSKRVRKISAPNILSQRNGHATFGVPHVHHGTLNRTASAPNKVNELLRMSKENLPQIDQSTMLEENDEILLAAFEDLQLSDKAMARDTTCDDGPKKIEDYNFDTTSTASVKTEEQSSQNGSISLVRRLSSPTFLKLKKTTALKVKNGRPPVLNDKSNMKKAKSESPPSFKSSSHNIHIIQKSSSFEEDALKFRKNNSFKKLFKKLF